jgi:hypothetical protein
MTVMERLNTLPKLPRGRPPGAKNRVQAEAKAVIAEAAANLGGANRLLEWDKEDPINERAFWATIYPKLLPLTVTANGTITIEKVVRTIIDPKCAP